MVTSWENRAAPALSVYSSIAQSVERMTVNHDVAGSSPAWGATTHTGEPKIIIINGSLLLSVKRI